MVSDGDCAIIQHAGKEIWGKKLGKKKAHVEKVERSTVHVNQ
jgi:hypothetical protein